MWQATIGRWGKNLAVRFPADVVKAVGFADGERVEALAENGQVIIRKIASGFNAERMFRGKRPEEWRALYDNVYDWGVDRGRESVEE
jgi:antitoxin component of MazEF toxin-antitoxin module